MTFNTSLKEELSKLSDNNLEKRIFLHSYLLYGGKSIKELLIVSENASVIRKVYQDFKEIYGIRPRIKIRIQRRFRVKQIYMLSIDSKIEEIKNNVKLNSLIDFEVEEEMISFLKGAFLAIGSVTDPKTSGYHLEFSCIRKKDANKIIKILDYFSLSAKIVIRSKKYIVYVKSSEDISDIIKLFKAVNSLFYFEDIRIYRDHKNMVNRLNNCDIANQEKTIKTGMKHLESIKYLRDNDLIDLLDDKVKTVILMREKYPDASFNELAEIISMETDYKIGKSGINHNFIKINEIINKHRKVSK